MPAETTVSLRPTTRNSVLTAHYDVYSDGETRIGEIWEYDRQWSGSDRLGRIISGDSFHDTLEWVKAQYEAEQS